jgi:hypothetical protein
MFGIQDSALHPMRCSVTTLKEEPLGSAAAAAAAATAHNLHQVTTLRRVTAASAFYTSSLQHINISMHFFRGICYVHFFSCRQQIKVQEAKNIGKLSIVLMKLVQKSEKKKGISVSAK